MSEYYEGETEDVWTNQIAHGYARQRVTDLSNRLSAAHQRREDATNPVSYTIASVAIFVNARRMEKAAQQLSITELLPKPPTLETTIQDL